MTQAPALCIAVIAAALAACNHLDPIEPGTCGNLVVEAGEQCDGTTNGGPACGTTGPAACRFVCDPSAAAPSCPAGLGCGAQGVCVASTGQLVSLALAPRYRFTASQIFAGDIDGDHFDELVGVGNTLRVRFGASDAPLASEYEKPIRAPTGPAALGAFDDQPGLDLIYPAAAGVFTLLARGREFDAVPYASLAALEPRNHGRDCEPPAGSGWAKCRLGDVNADGRPDLIGYVAGRDDVEVRFGRAAGPPVPYLIDTADVITDLDVGDLDGDGFDDIAYATRPAGPGGAEAVRTVFGAPQPSSLVDAPLTRADHIAGIAVNDATISGDGLADVMVARELAGQASVAVFLGDASRSLTAPFALARPQPPSPLAIGPSATPLDTPFALVAGELVGGPGSGVDVMAYATNPNTPGIADLWWLAGTTGGRAQLQLDALDAVPISQISFLADHWQVANVLGDPSTRNGPDEVLGLAASTATCAGPAIAVAVPSARATSESLLRSTCLDVTGAGWTPAQLAVRSGATVALAQRAGELWLGATDDLGAASARGVVDGATVTLDGATGCRNHAVWPHGRGTGIDVSALCEVNGVTAIIHARGTSSGATVVETVTAPGATGHVVGDFNGDGLDDLAIVFGADIAIVLQCSTDMVGRTPGC